MSKSWYKRMRVVLYLWLVFFYTFEILFDDFSEVRTQYVQFELRQGFGYALLSISCASLAMCAARLEMHVVLSDAALFSFTLGRCLLIAFAGFPGETYFFVVNIINIFMLPFFDASAKMESRDENSLSSQSIADVNSRINMSNNSEMYRSTGNELRSHVTEDELYEGFRVRIDKLPEANTAVTNVPWTTFTNVEHRIDSSSCHIYTANWGERLVILKLIKADRVGSPVAVAEFETEASVLSRVKHPHIVKFLGSGYEPRRFLVLELLDGGSLSHALGVRVDKHNQRSWRRNFTYEETLAVSRAMASALHYLHDLWQPSISIIHRDLKPDNIGFTSDGMIKLFDFGLCSCIRQGKEKNEAYEMTGNTGTLRYMAPEVALGKSYNQSVDAYSFGIIVWQILRGKVPFHGMGRRTYMDCVVLGGERPRLDKRWPPRFSRLLQRCWHADYQMRPSFSEIVTELDGLILASQITTKNRLKNCLGTIFRPSEATIKRIRPFAFLIALTLVICSLVLVLHYRHEDAGVSLAVCSAFLLYLITLSYVGVKTRPVPSQDPEGSDHSSTMAPLDPTTFNPIQKENKKVPLHGVDG
eukprot:gene2153-4191_t